jgi:AAA domain
MSNHALTGPKVLLMGAPGAGKTRSIVTLLQEGLTVFVIATEPNAIDVILDACQKLKLDWHNKLHWVYVRPMSSSWKSLDEMRKTITYNSFEDIQKLKHGVDKPAAGAAAKKLLDNLSNFTCDHCGHSFGGVETWDDNNALVLDSLSGLNLITMQNTIGLKPAAHQGEWGVAMNFEETIINALVSDLSCWFVLIAHIDRNSDQLTGGTVITPGALGAKLGPRLGRFFGEVVLAKRKGDQFSWSTSEAQADVKNRLLPISADLQPSFSKLADRYRLMKESTVKAAPVASNVPAAKEA